MSNYWETLRKDLPASVVVFFVALPLCLGIALASGAPMFSGLIAGIVGGLVVGSISGSSLGVSGPAAGLTVIVLAAIEALGSFEAFLVAVVLAGLIQVILGALRAGVLGYFFPSSVIHGMLTGIGIIIILKQIPHALGYDSNPSGDLSFSEVDGGTTLSALFEMLGFIHPGVLLISVVSLAILIAWESPMIKHYRWLAMAPGPVVAVVFAVVAQLLIGSFQPLALQTSQLVQVPVANGFTEFAGLFTVPDFVHLNNPAVWTTAITLAIVASLETLLSVEAIDKMDPEKRVTPTNRELVAQGIGNSLSGLIGGLPVTQVIVRSTVNLQTGARTKASAIIHGVLILVCVAAVPHILNMIPLGVLAAVLIVTGYKLAKPALFQRMWNFGYEQFFPFVITVLGVVMTDLLVGVAMGMAAAILLLLQRNFRNSHFLHLQDRAHADNHHIITMRLAEEVTFLNKGAIKKELSRIPDNAELIIDKRNCIYINHDVAEIIADFINVAQSRGIRVKVIENDREPELSGDGLLAVA